jgi:hypothetical protein
MMLWHKVDPKTGKIVATCNVTTKLEALQQLGNGYIVSDASWRLDVFKFKPIQTVVTDVVQEQKSRAPALPEGKIGTARACQLLGIPERQFRHLAEKYQIRPKRLKYGARYVNAYTPLQVEALRQCL